MIPNKKSFPRFSFRDPMTSTKALKVLGLPPDASFDQIKAGFDAMFERTGGEGDEFRRAALAYAMLYVPPQAPVILFSKSPVPWISPAWCICNKKVVDAEGQELMDPRCIGTCPLAAQIIDPALRRAARHWSRLPGFDVVEEAMAALLRRDAYKNKPFPKSHTYSVAFGVGFDEWKRLQNQANRGDKRFGRVTTVSMTAEEGKKAVEQPNPTITPDRAFAIFETLLDELGVSNTDAALIYRHRHGLHGYAEMDIKAISRMMRRRDPKWTVALVTTSIERTTKWLLKRRQEQLLKLIVDLRAGGHTFAQIARFIKAQTGNRWSALQIKKICEEGKMI